MLTWWRARTPTGRKASKFYGSIVTAARREKFYSDYGVPDTPEGRFAMIVIHLVPVLDRLQREGTEGAALGRALTETFVTDMDDYLREIGVSDLKVPGHVKKAAGALYECTRDCRAAIAALDNARLEEAIGRILLPEGSPAAPALAVYMRKAALALGTQPAEQLLAADVSFPPP